MVEYVSRFTCKRGTAELWVSLCSNGGPVESVNIFVHHWVDGLQKKTRLTWNWGNHQGFTLQWDFTVSVARLCVLGNPLTLHLFILSLPKVDMGRFPSLWRALQRLSLGCSVPQCLEVRKWEKGLVYRRNWPRNPSSTAFDHLSSPSGYLECCCNGFSPEVKVLCSIPQL